MFPGILPSMRSGSLDWRTRKPQSHDLV